ncbi:hypothetical protein CBR_g51003 [Chara braunii]|uniref:Uncharacterized protein n=1 Tax=Chara braunii TaxID=69332 RepID=A0A388M816_CHABU|nr:hypothetical protein CBR_g51003 [Chara braunii]|eukprot:GBG90655.1 hypothetical protein CBR_g51003 [Chara braunii]
MPMADANGAAPRVMLDDKEREVQNLRQEMLKIGETKNSTGDAGTLGVSRWPSDTGAAAGILNHGQISGLDDALSRRVKTLERALQDGEIMMAKLRSRVRDAEAGRRDMEGKMAEKIKELEVDKDALECKLRHHREDGFIKTKGLEDAVRILSGKSNLHAEFVRLETETSKVRMEESRLKSDLQFAEDRLAGALRDLKESRKRLTNLQALQDDMSLWVGISIASKLPSHCTAGMMEAEHGDLTGSSQPRSLVADDGERETKKNEEGIAHNPVQMQEPRRGSGDIHVARLVGELRERLDLLASRDELVVSLAARAETAEKDVEELSLKLASIEQNRQTSSGGDDILSPNSGEHRYEVYELQLAEMQRQMRLLEDDLKAACEGREMLQLEFDKVQVQLGEVEQQLIEANSKLADRERELKVTKEAGEQHATTGNISHMSEILMMGKQISEAERKLEATMAELKDANERARALHMENDRLKVLVADLNSQRQKRAAGNEENVVKAEIAAKNAKEEVERLTSIVQERGIQMAILMETMDTLQGGDDNEQEQRIVNLTTQLTAAKAIEGDLERRTIHLQVLGMNLQDNQVLYIYSRALPEPVRGQLVAESKVGKYNYLQFHDLALQREQMTAQREVERVLQKSMRQDLELQSALNVLHEREGHLSAMANAAELANREAAAARIELRAREDDCRALAREADELRQVGAAALRSNRAALF